MEYLRNELRITAPRLASDLWTPSSAYRRWIFNTVPTLFSSRLNPLNRWIWNIWEIQWIDRRTRATIYRMRNFRIHSTSWKAFARPVAPRKFLQILTR